MPSLAGRARDGPDRAGLAAAMPTPCWRPSRQPSGRSFWPGRTFPAAGPRAAGEARKATGTPVVTAESPRGIADATLGAFPEVTHQRRPDRVAGQGARFHHPLGIGSDVRSRRSADLDRSRGASRRPRGQREGGAIARRLRGGRLLRRATPWLRARVGRGAAGRLAARGPRGDRRSAGPGGRSLADCRAIAPGRGIPRLAPDLARDPGRRPGLRRRRVCPVGTEPAAGEPAPGQRRRRLHRELAAVRTFAGLLDPAAPSSPCWATARSASILRVRDGRATPPAVRGDPRQRRLLERRAPDTDAATTAPLGRMAARFCLPARIRWCRPSASRRAGRAPASCRPPWSGRWPSGKPACINVMVESVAAPVVRGGDVAA